MEAGCSASFGCSGMSGCSSTTDPSNLVKSNEATMHTPIAMSNVHNAHKQHTITDFCVWTLCMNCTPFIYVNLLMLIVLWICALYKYVCATFWGIYIFLLNILDYITITLHVYCELCVIYIKKMVRIYTQMQPGNYQTLLLLLLIYIFLSRLTCCFA